MKLLFLLLSTTLFALSNGLILADGTCPEGAVQGSHNPNECYKLVATGNDWYSAEDACKKMKGHLASIHDAYSNSFFVGMVGGGAPGFSDFWIGANNNNGNSSWQWIDNTPFNFDDWAPGNPRPDPAVCLSARIPSGFWYSTDCRQEKPAICSIPPAHAQQPSCLPGWNYFDNTTSCYKIVYGSINNNMTCDLANQLCFNLNASLASIHSDAENFFITGLVMSYDNSGYYTAIGLVSDGYVWKWRDGSEVDYTNWYSSSTTTKNYCAVLRGTTDGYASKWFSFDHNQMSSGGFNKGICKMSAYASQNF